MAKESSLLGRTQPASDMPAASIVMSFSDYNLGVRRSILRSPEKRAPDHVAFRGPHSLLLQNRFQLAIGAFFVVRLNALEVHRARISGPGAIPGLASLEEHRRVAIVGIALQHGPEPIRGLVEHAALPQRVPHVELIRGIALIAIQRLLKVVHCLRQVAARLRGAEIVEDFVQRQIGGDQLERTLRPGIVAAVEPRQAEEEIRLQVIRIRLRYLLQPVSRGPVLPLLPFQTAELKSGGREVTLQADGLREEAQPVLILVRKKAADVVLQRVDTNRRMPAQEVLLGGSG